MIIMEDFVDKADNYLLGFHKRAGEWYQDKTGGSARDLEKSLYGLSAACFALSPDYNPIDFGVAISIVYGGSEATNGNIRTLEKMYSTAKQAGSTLSTSAYLSGAIATLRGIIDGIDYLYTGNDESKKYSLQFLRIGAGLLALGTAMYLSRNDFEDPPKKPGKETFSEKFRNLIESMGSKPQTIPTSNG